MNERRDEPFVDPLEVELAEFRPVAPTPRLARDITEALLQAGQSHARRRRWIFAAAALAAAACVVVAISMWHRERETHISIAIGPTTSVAVELPPPAPTWRSYEDAFARSPEAFDALLDRHARTLLRSPRSLDLQQLTGDKL